MPSSVDSPGRHELVPRSFLSPKIRCKKDRCVGPSALSRIGVTDRLSVHTALPLPVYWERITALTRIRHIAKMSVSGVPFAEEWMA